MQEERLQLRILNYKGIERSVPRLKNKWVTKGMMARIGKPNPLKDLHATNTFQSEEKACLHQN